MISKLESDFPIKSNILISWFEGNRFVQCLFLYPHVLRACYITRDHYKLSYVASDLSILIYVLIFLLIMYITQSTSVSKVDMRPFTIVTYLIFFLGLPCDLSLLISFCIQKEQVVPSTTRQLVNETVKFLTTDLNCYIFRWRWKYQMSGSWCATRRRWKI